MLVGMIECDVFVTADRGFGHEHNLEELPFGIVIVHVARNKVAFLSADLLSTASGCCRMPGRRSAPRLLIVRAEVRRSQTRNGSVKIGQPVAGCQTERAERSPNGNTPVVRLPSGSTVIHQQEPRVFLG